MRPIAFFARKSSLFVAFFLLIVFTNLISSCKKKTETKPTEETATVNSMPTYCPGLSNPCSDPACAPYFSCDPVISYGGVSITLESSSGMLKFNSTNDLNTVLNKLDLDNETYQSNYENQYSSYSEAQMDSIDDANNFDEFKIFRDFENLFSGYNSKRKSIEVTENSWLANSFTGTDPDDIDYTFDDAENTIFNSNNKYKIANNTYELKSDGLYKNGVFQDDAPVARVQGAVCRTNVKKRQNFPYGTDKKFKLKASVTSIGVRASMRGKVVCFKMKNGNWKRRRSEVAVGLVGTVRDNVQGFPCNITELPNRREPSTGYKKRKSLMTKKYVAAPTNYRVEIDELHSFFQLPDGSMETVYINW